jgi:hypothetical protein
MRSLGKNRVLRNDYRRKISTGIMVPAFRSAVRMRRFPGTGNAGFMGEIYWWLCHGGVCLREYGLPERRTILRAYFVTTSVLFSCTKSGEQEKGRTMVRRGTGGQVTA